MLLQPGQPGIPALPSSSYLPAPGGAEPLSPRAVPQGLPWSLGAEGRAEPRGGAPSGWCWASVLGPLSGSMDAGWTPFLTAPAPQTVVNCSQLGQQGRPLLPGLSGEAEAGLALMALELGDA